MDVSLAAELEQTILDHRILPIDATWTDEIVFPYYEGLSIRNLAHTIYRLLLQRAAANHWGSAPLDARLWESRVGGVDRVVFFLSDGLGWRLLNEIRAEDPVSDQLIADLVGDEGTLTPLTSIAPSTTAAALPCIWTGAAPSATGMVGTTLFLREFGTLASMLHFRPLSGRHREEALEDWGLNFDSFLPLATLGEALAARRIPSYVLLQKDLFGSGLSRLMHRGIKHVVRHIGYTDLWITLHDLLKKTRNQRCFVNIYWGAVDSVSHLYGTVTEQTITEIRRQLADLHAVLAAGDVGDGRTLFIFTADHGHTPVPEFVNVGDHPPVADALRCGLGGEGRFSHLYLRHDFRDQVVDYLADQMGDRLAVVMPGQALAAGLYGPEAPYDETGPRLGDLTVIARAGICLGDRPLSAFSSMSRHGGLSDREMLVPLLMRMM